LNPSPSYFTIASAYLDNVEYYKKANVHSLMPEIWNLW